MVDDDDGDRFPSLEPRADSRSALPRVIRAWRRLHIVKCDEFFSLIFFLPETQYMELELESERHQGAHEVVGRALEGQACPHPRGQVVGPLAFIVCKYFSYFLKSCSVKFQVIPRTFVSTHK